MKEKKGKRRIRTRETEARRVVGPQATGLFLDVCVCILAAAVCLEMSIRTGSRILQCLEIAGDNDAEHSIPGAQQSGY